MFCTCQEGNRFKQQLRQVLGDVICLLTHDSDLFPASNTWGTRSGPHNIY